MSLMKRFKYRKEIKALVPNYGLDPIGYLDDEFCFALVEAEQAMINGTLSYTILSVMEGAPRRYVEFDTGLSILIDETFMFKGETTATLALPNGKEHFYRIRGNWRELAHYGILFRILGNVADYDQ